jgi:hypothetical protein
MRSTLAILALLAGPAAAESAIDDLLGRTREARGPEQAWAGVEALRMEADFNQNGRESRLLVLRQGQRVRMEATFQGESDVLVYDGEHGWWRSREGDGEWEELTGAALTTRLQTVDLYLPPRDVWHRFESVETLGPADVDGEPAVRLRGRLAGGEEQDLYVALDSQEVRRWDRTLGPPGEELTVPAFLYDYREVEGMTFPHYVEISFGTGMLSVAVEVIEIDPELPPGLFDDPSGDGKAGTDGAGVRAGGIPGIGVAGAAVDQSR